MTDVAQTVAADPAVAASAPAAPAVPETPAATERSPAALQADANEDTTEAPEVEAAPIGSSPHGLRGIAAGPAPHPRSHHKN
jgi:hypothetical protein